MAKQSGLHQIKGKVGGFSYYRQSGVNSGLLRRINEAMSGRVKTGDEYTNTRLNNAEFRNAADVAKILGQTITPKYRPMILPFSQSKLTADLLGLIKQVEGNWGERNVVASQASLVLEALNKLAKNDFAGMYGQVRVALDGESSDTVGMDLSDDVINNLRGLGIDGVIFSVRSFCLGAGQYSAVIGKNIPSMLSRVAATDQDITATSGASFEAVVNFDNTLPVGFEAIPMYVIVALPYRTINSVKHTLQEYCSFTAVSPVTE